MIQPENMSTQVSRSWHPAKFTRFRFYPKEAIPQARAINTSPLGSGTLSTHSITWSIQRAFGSWARTHRKQTTGRRRRRSLRRRPETAPGAAAEGASPGHGRTSSIHNRGLLPRVKTPSSATQVRDRAGPHAQWSRTASAAAVVSVT